MASIEVSLYDLDLDDSELIDELESRGYTVIDNGGEEMNIDIDVLRDIHTARKLGKPYEQMLDNFLNDVFGTAL